MIKKNLVRHSMTLCDMESRVFGNHIYQTDRIPRRWFLKINDIYFYIKLESEPGSFRNTPTSPRMCLNPNQLEIKLIGIISTEFLRDWMASDRKLDVTLERLNPVGDVLEKWQLYGSFIQEMHHEIVYDRTIDDIKIRLNYDYINLIN